MLFFTEINAEPFLVGEVPAPQRWRQCSVTLNHSWSFGGKEVKKLHNLFGPLAVLLALQSGLNSKVNGGDGFPW